jgi:hypothetical protein
VGTRNGGASRQSISATEPAVGAAKADGISAGDPPVDAAKDTPAIPSTDRALLGRFPFEARFACNISEFLLTFLRTPRDEPIVSVAHVRFEYHYARQCISVLERLSAISKRQLSHLAPRRLHSLTKSQAS